MSDIHPSAAEGFGRHAERYQQARPDYPPQLVQWLRQNLGLDHTGKVMDVGAGTGKLLPTILQVTPNVTAVEPIAAMLQQLQMRFPSVATLQSDSRHLNVVDNSLDAILCGQSFHWFADTASIQEFARVLQPRGALGLIWNQRDTKVDWVAAIADLLGQFENDTPRFHQGIWQAVFNEQPYFTLQGIDKFPFIHRGTVQQVVIERSLSTSFIAALDNTTQAEIRQQLISIMADYTGKSPLDDIEMPYLTHAYYYQKN